MLQEKNPTKKSNLSSPLFAVPHATRKDTEEQVWCGQELRQPISIVITFTLYASTAKSLVSLSV